MFKFLYLNQIWGNVIKKYWLCNSCMLVICFQEGRNTKGQEAAKKWPVEVKTRLVEVETRSMEVEKSGRGGGRGRKRPDRVR